MSAPGLQVHCSFCLDHHPRTMSTSRRLKYAIEYFDSSKSSKEKIKCTSSSEWFNMMMPSFIAHDKRFSVVDRMRLLK